jgi:hypothetical protein
MFEPVAGTVCDIIVSLACLTSTSAAMRPKSAAVTTLDGFILENIRETPEIVLAGDLLLRSLSKPLVTSSIY